MAVLLHGEGALRRATTAGRCGSLFVSSLLCHPSFPSTTAAARKASVSLRQLHSHVAPPLGGGKQPPFLGRHNKPPFLSGERLASAASTTSEMVGKAVVGTTLASMWLAPTSLYNEFWVTRWQPTSNDAIAFRRGTHRYDAILDHKGDLWTNEEVSTPIAETPVFFDWMSTLPEEKVPQYAHPSDPRKAELLPMYTKPVGDGQEARVVDVVLSINTPRYEVPRDDEGYPLSPVVTVGKTSTGVRGRGVLGRWGPNLAGDAVITRRHATTGKLQVVLIKRTDGSEKYAFPGGFVDDGEALTPEKTAIREFLEEAMDVHHNEALVERGRGRRLLERIFGDFSVEEVNGRKEVTFEEKKEFVGKATRLIYAGFMNDKRNTDNAWIETVAFNWHLEEPEASALELVAGDDAAKDSAAFYDVVDDPRLNEKGVVPLKNLFAAHSPLLRFLLDKHFPADLPPPAASSPS